MAEWSSKREAKVFFLLERVQLRLRCCRVSKFSMIDPLLRWCSPSFYRRLGPHPGALRGGRVPTWRRSRGAGCTAAGMPMDPVHGRKACP